MTILRNLRFKRSGRLAVALLAGAGSLSSAVLIGNGAAQASSSSTAGGGIDGLAPGSIQHVWLIILENKSYDETFTGLNSNSYLWQTLPSEGVLLKNYYGTGHSSMDNYISLVSGQAPEEDTQQDCSTANTPFGSNSSIVTTGAVGADTPNWNYGQVASLLGANAAIGSGSASTVITNGCTYPKETPTLFDQFNAAGISWKGYAQDLGGAQPIGSTSYVADAVPNRDDGVCGAPGSASENPVSSPTYLTATTAHPLPSDVSSYTAASLVTGTGTTAKPQYSDAYVAKHFPFPWFESLIGGYDPTTGTGTGTLTEPLASAGGGSNCDATHIDNLDDPTHGLVADLNNNTVPQFSWITPDNCSDAHDTTCKGNNLSGAFVQNAQGQPILSEPIYHPSGGLPAFDPEATTPVNYTGGLYASDLFLAYYVPLIEDSAAYSHGLIDITFDEGEPSFTYSGNSFNNVLTGPSSVDGTNYIGTSSPQSSAPADAPSYGTGGTAPGADSIYGAYGISADAAGETVGGSTVKDEPFGPNSTLATDGSGNQLAPGPGNNAFIDRPPLCNVTSTATSGTTTSLTDASQSWAANQYDGFKLTITGGTGSGETGTVISGTSSTVNLAATLTTAPDATSTYTLTNPNSVVGCLPTITRGGSGNTAAARTDTITSTTGSELTDASIIGDDTGRAVTSITSTSGTVAETGLFVGAVSDTGPLYPTTSGGATVLGQFQLVDPSGTGVTPPAGTTKIVLGAEGDPNVTLATGVTADPLWDATDPTPGGGDTGSVLISPYITPNTTSSTYYNHYSWLRTMEDLFDVSSCAGTSTDVTLPAGTVCAGLDSAGHIGYAAQTGLADFGTDVFSSDSGSGFQQIPPPNALPETPLVIALPALAGLLLMGAYLVTRRRKGALNI